MVVFAVTNPSKDNFADYAMGLMKEQGGGLNKVAAEIFKGPLIDLMVHRDNYILFSVYKLDGDPSNTTYIGFLNSMFFHF